MRTTFIPRILAVLLIAALPLAARAELAVGVSIDVAPPPLPVYTQPVLPGPGYIWVPGYWAWGEDDYYWVPGTWAQAPEAGLLWTPGWWGWNDGTYAWHDGYWAPQVGFYGGIDYGFGYSGHGYDGGYWRDRQFYYNRSVTNLSNTTNITNVYNKTVVNTSVNHVAYNGGPGGVSVQPTAPEKAAASARHVGPTALQARHQDTAASNRDLRAAANGGKPSIAATAKPAEFSGPDVIAARAAGGPVQPRRGPDAQQRGQERGQAQNSERNRTQPAPAQERQQRAQAQPEQRPQQQQRTARAPEQQRAEAAQQRERAPEQRRAEPPQRSAPTREAQAPAERPARPSEARPSEARPEARPGESPRNEKNPQGKERPEEKRPDQNPH